MLLQRCFYLSIVCFSLFHLFPALSYGAQANFSWLPNTEANLAGYKIHYGTTSENYINVTDAGLSEPVDGRVYVVIEGLSEGDTYYFAATAYDSDGNESGFSQEVSYTVFPEQPSLPPVAYDLSVDGTEDTPLTGQLNVDNSGGLLLQFDVISGPSHGTLTVEDTTGVFSYTPIPDFNGTDGFTFSATNDHGESNPANVEIVINSANDAPVAIDSNFSTAEGVTLNGQLQADDPDNDNLHFILVSAPQKGAAVINSNGSFSYSPEANSSGTDSFSFKVNDGKVDSSPATVSITINPVNDAPIAHNSTISVNADSTTNGQLNATDPEGTALTYSLTSSPNQGSVTISPDGAFTYTADKDSSGNDSFSFQADDGTNTSNIATVSITINRADNPLRFEVGELHVSSDWQVVHFDASFANPVVVVGASSLNDVEPGIVRVKNVTADGFEVRFQEWDYLDDSHPEEIITYLVMEQGHFTLDDGSQVEADCFPISGASSFSTVSFNQTMAVPPVIQTSVTTYNEDDAVTTRLRNISTSEFDFMMREQESNAATHGSETVCYIAWEPSRGELAGMSYDVAVTDDEVTHNPYEINYSQQLTEVPMVLAGMQSTDGGDTTVVRIRENTITDATIFLSEEQSKDSETNHTTETVGYIAFGSDQPPVNQPPIVNAGADQSVTLPDDTAALDGTATDDGQPVGTLDTEWLHIGGLGTGSVSFADPYAEDTTVTFGDAGTYILELSADDGEFIRFNSMTVTVLDAAELVALTVSPDVASVTVGNTVQFSATGVDQYSNTFTVDADWESSCGTISTPGLYTAPSFAGECKVTASVGTINNTVTVTVTDELIPIEPTVVEMVITTGADDAEEKMRNGSISLTSRDLEMVEERRGQQLIGLRFNNLDIPQDATITNAWIQFTVDERNTDYTSLTIEGEHAGDAAPFTRSSYNISSRDRTLSAVEWQPPAWSSIGASGADQRTTDIKDIVQEIVEMADWASDNSMAFIISGDGKRVAESYEGSAAAAILHVEFQ